MSSLELVELGFRGEEVRLIESLLSLPRGLIVVSGSAGSGKSTTLASCVRHFSSLDRKDFTTIDPISGPRSIGLVLESVRDGRLAVGTLEAVDATWALHRLIDLGVPRRTVTETLHAIVVQRLFRRTCGECKEVSPPTEAELLRTTLTFEELEGKSLFRGSGCHACLRTGYRGRTAILEILLITDRIRELILRGGSSDRLLLAAREQGMRTLRESAILAVLDGLTTIEEAGL